MTSKSPITTERCSGRRLPRHRSPTHPGDVIIEEFLKPLGLSQTEFARRLDVSYPRLNEIINRRRGVTPDTALRLARVTGMPATFWLGLQLDYDLWQAMNGPGAEAVEKLVPLECANEDAA